MKNADALNRTIWIADNLPFLRSLDTESVDLVVIDPPFGKKQTFTGNLKPPLTDAELEHEYELLTEWGVQNEEDAYDVGIEFPDQTGTTAKFADIWDFRFQVTQADWDWLEDVCPAARALIDATRLTHSDGIAGYITFMTLRMMEIHRILKPTGSVYLHCDHEANAYLRQMMDAVFGQGCFRNEIVWKRFNFHADAKRFGRVSDTILYYTKTDQFQFKAQRIPFSREYVASKFSHLDKDGRRYRLDNLNPPGGRGPIYEFHGVIKPWRLTKENMLELERQGRIYTGSKIAQLKRFLDELDGQAVHNIWTDVPPINPRAKERTGYPTQKPQELAKRIIAASSNPGDLVLDCFAGCAYVPVAAELLGRRWIACDMSPRAWTVVRRQFEKQPDLGILTEGTDIGAGQHRMQTAEALAQGRAIRVRGPNELPIRTTNGDVQRPMLKLKPVVFRVKPKETSQVIWDAFVAEWGTECWYCGTPMAKDRRVLQLDHIEPRDGTNDDCWNRALACSPCNSDKGNALTPEKTIEKALESGRIDTPARRDEQLGRFKTRMDWTKDRWEDVRARRPRVPLGPSSQGQRH